MSSDLKRLIVVGCNHQHTPLEIRERLALGSDAVEQLLAALRADPVVSECLVLNTCNRVEVYAVTQTSDWAALFGHHLEKLNQYSAHDFLKLAYVFEGEEAVQHAFKVASGLDSQIVGETQILGQMKAAYTLAGEREVLGGALHRLFQKAFQGAKWAHTSTGISSGQISLGNVAVELASRIFGKLTVSRTLIVGSGEVGQEVAKAFRSRGVACMSIASRTPERAELLAKSVDGLVIPFKTWHDHLPFTDIGIFATSSPQPLVTASSISEIMVRRHHKPLFFIDLAMPRDIHPEVGTLPNAFLYNLEDLSSIANENLLSRKADVDSCLVTLHRKAAATWQRIESGFTR